MARFTRRELLRGLGTAGLGFLLTGCMPRLESKVQSTSTVGPTASQPIRTSAAPSTEIMPTSTASVGPSSPETTSSPRLVHREPTPVPAGRAYLAVVRGASPEEITRRAIAAIGGIERFVKKGDNVIIKPNICNANYGPEYASTTNPQVVAELVRLCVGAGAKRVRVMDFPFSGSAQAAYARSGIGEAVKAAGGVMEVMSPAKFVKVRIPEGVDLKEWSFYRPVLEADVLIDVPIAKDHGLARLTLAAKNLMGVIQNRPQLHRNLGQRIADITSLVRPQLTVVDAVRILVQNGPTGGSLDYVRRANTIIASHDIVAADAYATGLFGLKPQDIAYIVAGARMGLGTMDLASVKVVELSI